ncbi:MAG TPA: energy transducer TonB [Silvibacterium sp.]|nr:energy transducer TonB [Silvibacterium sp.]
MTLALLLVGLVGTVSASTGTSRATHETTPPETIASQSGNGQESRPNPDASGVYHAGKGVTPPQITYSVDPEFADKARRKKLGGTCIIAMVVDGTGTPQDVHIVTSIASSVAPKLRSAAKGMDENAVKAAKQYRFKPGTYQGKPVPVEIQIEINYRIY